MSTLLEISDLEVRYGAVSAVKGVNLTLAAGEIVAVIGPNGAGKTAALNAIMGVLPSSGSIRVDGVEFGGLETEERVARGLSLVSERRELFGQMSVEDNLVLGGYTHHRPGRSDLSADLSDVLISS